MSELENMYGVKWNVGNYASPKLILTPIVVTKSWEILTSIILSISHLPCRESSLPILSEQRTRVINALDFDSVLNWHFGLNVLLDILTDLLKFSFISAAVSQDGILITSW